MHTQRVWFYRQATIGWSLTKAAEQAPKGAWVGGVSNVKPAVSYCRDLAFARGSNRHGARRFGYLRARFAHRSSPAGCDRTGCIGHHQFWHCRWLSTRSCGGRLRDLIRCAYRVRALSGRPTMVESSASINSGFFPCGNCRRECPNRGIIGKSPNTCDYGRRGS